MPSNPEISNSNVNVNLQSYNHLFIFKNFNKLQVSVPEPKQAMFKRGVGVGILDKSKVYEDLDASHRHVSRWCLERIKQHILFTWFIYVKLSFKYLYLV